MVLEAVLCIGIFGGFFVLRAILATIFFYYILPEGDRCPQCDTPTLRVESTWWNRLLPCFRTSWCYDCGWHGLLRHGAITEVKPARSLSKKA